MSDLVDCLKQLIADMAPGTIAIIKLSDSMAKEDKSKRGELAEQMDNAEIKSPSAGGGYQGGAGL